MLSLFHIALPFLVVTASPGLRSFVVASALVPAALLALMLAEPDLVRPMLGAIGWMLGIGWWSARRLLAADDRPLEAAIGSATAYASAAALTLLVTIPLWQPVAVELLR